MDKCPFCPAKFVSENPKSGYKYYACGSWQVHNSKLLRMPECYEAELATKDQLLREVEDTVNRKHEWKEVPGSTHHGWGPPEFKCIKCGESYRSYSMKEPPDAFCKNEYILENVREILSRPEVQEMMEEKEGG